MVKIYREMSFKEWFSILEFIQDIRKSNSEIAKMNQKTYKVFGYLKAKYMGCFYHFNKDGNFRIFNEFVSPETYKMFAQDNMFCAMIAGCKIIIDEMINDGEIIIL